MTPSTGRPSSDDVLEARLRATFDRNVAVAATDIAAGDAPVVRPRPGRARRAALVVAAGAVGVTVLAIALGGVSPRPQSNGVIGASPSPAASASIGGSGSPEASGNWPGPVYPVGAGAEGRIAAATDATEFLVSGWILGVPDAKPCATSTPSGWDPCTALRLHPAVGGGPGLELYRLYGSTMPAPAVGSAMHVTARVRTHDAACSTPACQGLPFLLGFVDVQPEVAIAAQPPQPIEGVIGEEVAQVVAARAAFGGAIDPSLAIVSATLAPAGMSSPIWPEVDATRWAWTVTLAHPADPTGTEVVVLVDAEKGVSLGSWSATGQPSPIPTPSSALPAVLGLVPVHQVDDARAALSQSPNDVPLLVGGWIRGIDRRVCDPAATLVRSGTWNPCSGMWLHATPSGGAPLVLLADRSAVPPASSMPADGESIPVVLRVQTIMYSGDGPARPETLPMAGEVVWTGTPVKSLDIGAAPQGISVAAAERAGKPYQLSPSATRLRVATKITLAAYTAITGNTFSAPGVTQDTWVWLLLYTDDSVSPRSAEALLVTLADGQPVGATGRFP